MATIESPSPELRIIYNLAGSGLSGTVNVGQIPAGCVVTRVSVVTVLAGTGSSSPTIALGISGTSTKYVNTGTLTVSAGVATYTVNSTNTIPTAAETLQLTYGGTLPTNSTYNAYLIIECFKVA